MIMFEKLFDFQFSKFSLDDFLDILAWASGSFVFVQSSRRIFVSLADMRHGMNPNVLGRELTVYVIFVLVLDPWYNVFIHFASLNI